MDLKLGVILKYEVASIWVQYISDGDINGCIVFDGTNERYVSTKDLKGLSLPIGLSALGFVNNDKDNPEFPKYNFFRNGKMEIMENENQQYFIKGQMIRFTHEVQEIFDLYKLLPKANHIL